jgi:hypothetical protein
VVWTHQEGRVADVAGGAIDFDLDTLGIGGTYEWLKPKAMPFVSGTIGLTVVSPETAGLDRDLLPTITVGGGIKLPVSARVAVRLEGRGIVMVAAGGTSGICGGGGCVLAFAGSGIGQLELLAGLSWSP